MKYAKRETFPDLLKAIEPHVRDAVERIGRNRFRLKGCTRSPDGSLVGCSVSADPISDIDASHGGVGLDTQHGDRAPRRGQFAYVGEVFPRLPPPGSCNAVRFARWRACRWV
jgi:hypothetical protein